MLNILRNNEDILIKLTVELSYVAILKRFHLCGIIKMVAKPTSYDQNFSKIPFACFYMKSEASKRCITYFFYLQHLGSWKIFLKPSGPSISGVSGSVYLAYIQGDIWHVTSGNRNYRV